MVDEPEKLPLTTVCSVRVFSFLLNRGPLPAVHIEQLSDIRISVTGMWFVCPVSGPTSGRQDGATEREVLVFAPIEGFGFLLLAADLCDAAGPTNGRRPLVPIIAAGSGIWSIAPAWPSACAEPLRCRCVVGTAAPADPLGCRASNTASSSLAKSTSHKGCGSRLPGSGAGACPAGR